MRYFRAFLKFSRPHTIIGTTLSVSGLYLMAFAHTNAADPQLAALLLALASCLGANIYIVGLNQITDIDIDRINKPDLPLASGIFSMRTGWALVLISIGISLVLAVFGGKYLLLTVFASLLIGTAYSLPPLRLKRFHFWAAACIFTVRGVLVNLFLFLHFNEIFGGIDKIPDHIWALTAFVFGLSLVIAWFKDIPDMAGDEQFAIKTLSLKLGARRVFNIGMALLTLCYSGLIYAGFSGLSGVQPMVLAISHAILLAIVWLLARRVDPTKKPDIVRFYLIIWGMFFLEYIVFAIACLMA